jgi:hypothetical protein
MTNNKQQTTLQTLINGLIVRKENIIKNADSMSNDMLEGGVMAFESAIDLAQSLLEMEKQQEKETFIQSRNTISECPNWNCVGSEKKWESFEKYYEQTYGGGDK